MEIVVRNLNKVYQGKITALQQINITIGTGMFGLLGPNGAGKTTFMRILATLIQPSSGSVVIGGYHMERPDDKWAIRALLGYLPQELALYGDLSAYEFLEFVAALKKIPLQQRATQIQEVLEVTGLSEVARRRLKTYSGGMKRRVGVAQALLGNPALLIVDEPTVGLDPQERVRFRNMLTRLASDRTVILSTHIIEDVAQTCSQLAVLHRGSLLFSGAVHDLVQAAQGKVWEIAAANYSPGPELMLVSSIQLPEGIRYRVLADTKPHPAAQSVTPSLEDAYLWSVRER